MPSATAKRQCPDLIFVKPRFEAYKAISRQIREIFAEHETTGLDQRKDEVVELGMVKFDYLPDGRIAAIKDVFSSFNEPSEPIPLEVTALTGITNEMVQDNASTGRPSRRSRTTP
jgi:DNA polymerase III epsilon subunit-like protein